MSILCLLRVAARPSAVARWLAVLSVPLLLAASAAAEESALLEAVRDTTLIEHPAGALTNGAGPALFSGRTGQPQGSVRRALVAFDVAGALPGGARITAAALRLEIGGNPEPALLSLHRVLSAWGEGPSSASGGGGAPAEPGDATWIHTVFDTRFWLQPGGDFDPVASARAEVADAGGYRWETTSALLADVQSWLDAPGTNHGWILIGDESAASTAKRIHSRESPESAARPRLEVAYVRACEDADLRGGARALCTVYCEVLDCDGTPRASGRACERVARAFQRRSGIDTLPCEVRDADGDGVADDVDNCPVHANPGQADADVDTVGDACDNCPLESNPDQEDGFGAVGVGDACDCPCFTSGDVAALILALEDATVYTDLRCLDTTPVKPLTAVRAVRLDGAECALSGPECSAVAVTFTEDNACQLNPPADAPPVDFQGITEAQRDACRSAILEGAEATELACD